MVRHGGAEPVEGPAPGVSAGCVLPFIVLFIAVAVLAGAWLNGRGGAGDSAATTTTTAAAAEPVIATPEEPVAPEPPEGSFTVSAGESTSLDLDELARAIERRLSAAGHTSASVSVEGTVLQVDPGPGPLTVAAMQELLREPGRLEIRPVRRERRPEACADQPTAQGADDDARYPEYEFAGQRTGRVESCYQVAPGGITNAGIETASATVIPPDHDGNRDDDWAVQLGITFDGIDTFNEMAASCKHRESPCDAGLAAIALDQVVLMAPRVADEEFGRFDIQISGDIDEETANSMVAALTTAPLPRGLEFSP